MSKRVLIVGAGQAGAEMALALRQHQFDGAIVMVGAEAHLPYARPPLSKEFLIESLPAERLPFRSSHAYEKAGVELILGQAARRLDVVAKTLRLANGDVASYDVCILATGAGARKLPISGADLANIAVLRSIDDCRALRTGIVAGKRLVVIGAGYLGLEVAASARKRGADVTVIEAQPRILARSTSTTIAEAIAKRHAEAGVRLVLSMGVAGFLGEAGAVSGVRLSDGSVIDADFVLVAVGSYPEMGLAQAAGIACANGILVDEDCRTSAPAVFAIGDCAAWNRGGGAGPQRLESVQSAVQGARRAAAAIAGTAVPAAKPPYFWSNQFEFKLQIVGAAPAGLHTRDVLVGDAPGSFAVYRFDGEMLLAVEAVNSPKHFVTAQQIVGTHYELEGEREAVCH